MAEGDNQEPDWRDPPDEKIAAVALLLELTYGPRPWRRHGQATDVLVGTILSQHTSDTNTARAFASLRARFSSWDEVRSAPANEVAESIRSGGLANQKAPRIQAALDSIVAEQGSYDLRWLGEMPVVNAMAWLTSLNGVGPKTAACVLLFSLGMPALPVDTHVYRVAGRIGLIAPAVSAEAAHDRLLDLLGDDTGAIYAFHMEMIAHGRAVCTARRPACLRCPLLRLCRYAHETGASQ